MAASNTAATGDGGSTGPMDFDAAFSAASEEQGGGGDSSAESGDEADGDEDSTGDTDDHSAADSEEARQADETSDEGDTEDEGEGSEEEASEEGDAADDESANDESASRDLTAADPENKRLKALLEGMTPEQQKAARAYINKSLDPKFKAIAAATKFIKRFQEDPVAAAKQVLREKGVSVPDDAPKSGGDGKAKTADVAAPSAIAAQLAKAGFTKEQVAAVESVLKPVVESQNKAAVAAIAQSMEDSIETFKESHPEYDRLENQMSELMDEMPPSADVLREGGDRLQKYLGRLYTLAGGPAAQKKAVVKGVKDKIDRIKSNAASASPKAKGIPAGTVQPGKSGPLSLEESFELASRGETRGKGIRR